uniref:Uncharacterized protein n=1 Tax=Panagrolaimus sp. JU765 TaxID=591449 RepID=A0AC34QE80_9BILA
MNNPQQPPPTMNGKTGADAHFDYFKGWYDYLNEYAIVKKAKETYGTAKQSNPVFQDYLNMVENGVQTGLTDVAAPLYAQYCYPTTDKLVDIYSKGVDTTKVVADKTVAVAAHTGALSLGLAVVAAQMGLIATTSATNLFLSSLLYTKEVGNNAYQSVQSAEKVVESKIREAIEQTQQMAKIPVDKAAEHANTFLDIANAVFDKMLGLSDEKEPTDSTISDRIKFLTRRVSGGLVKRAHEDVIDPVKTKVHGMVEQMRDKLDLANVVKQRQQWVTEQAGNLSTNVLELKKKIELEAQQLRISPEEMLIRSIRKTSHVLNENFSRLREQGTQLVGDTATSKLDFATNYVQQLDTNFEKAENIYQIRDEVLVEAKQKITEIAQWTSSFLVGENRSQHSNNVQ